MISKLLLQGPSGSGKTSLILQTLQQAKLSAGGFVVQRLLLPTGVRAYCLTPAAEAYSPCLPYEPEQTGIFLDITADGAQFSADGFLRQFTVLTENQPFLVLDEIGGVELELPPVRQRLRELFRSDSVILGVWKSRANLERMIVRGNLTTDLLDYHDELETLFSSTHGALLVDHLPSTEDLHDFLGQNGLLSYLPGRRVCLQLLSNCSEAVRAHCLQTARLAAAIACSIATLDTELVLQAALLHDILRTEKDHAARGAELLHGMGYPALAAIIAEHMQLQPPYHWNETAVVWLADKCCQEAAIVSPQQRLTTTLHRYGPNETLNANSAALSALLAGKAFDPQQILIQYGGPYATII